MQTTANGQQLAAILDWARQNGEVKTIDRIRVMVLPRTLEEGVVLGSVGAGTACSAELVGAVRSAAAQVVGQPCPF